MHGGQFLKPSGNVVWNCCIPRRPSADRSRMRAEDVRHAPLRPVQQGKTLPEVVGAHASPIA